MKTRQDYSLRVKEGRTELSIDYEGKDLVFLYPAFGPGTYAQVKELIETAELGNPTMAQTASLVQAAFSSEDKYSKEIKEIMRKNWLWVFTGSKYIPKEGAYIQDNPETRDGIPFMDKSRLIRILEEETNKKIKTVRFVPFGYKIREQTSRELGKNPYVVGLAGEEGAEKLAEVADKFAYKPFLYSFDSVNLPETTVSGLDSGWLLGPRLGVFGDCRGGTMDGFALGYVGKKIFTGNKGQK